jgi:TonB family protein
MKAKLLFLTTLLLLSGCSLLWSPSATVKKFIAATEKGDVDTMTNLFSAKAVETMGAEKIRTNNQNFSDMIRKSIAAGAKPKISDLRETINGDSARVTFVYRDAARNDSMGLGFDLIKENGSWKILNIGDRSSEQITNSGVTTTTAPMLVETPPPAPLPAGNASESETKGETKSKTISGGVLNGKATSLPQPAYPPIARAAKASGTVVVQVTVDENGNVIAAHAVSGHPLLQAAAVAAAHNAKFSPTKLAGAPVKVTGVINYVFTAE